MRFTCADARSAHATVRLDSSWGRPQALLLLGRAPAQKQTSLLRRHQLRARLNGSMRSGRGSGCRTSRCATWRTWGAPASSTNTYSTYRHVTGTRLIVRVVGIGSIERMLLHRDSCMRVAGATATVAAAATASAATASATTAATVTTATACAATAVGRIR